MARVSAGSRGAPIGALARELRLDGGHGRYHRAADTYWGFAGRLFGGYSAALALVAAAREVEGFAPVSSWCRFLEPVRAGDVELVVERLRGGRTTAALRTTIVQSGRAMLTLDAWFAARDPGAIAGPGPTGAGAPEAPAVPPPEQCPPATWRSAKNSFDASFARRGIDFPTRRGEFVGRDRPVELWLRPEPEGELGPGVAPAVDLMCFDLHLTEPLVEQPGYSNERSFSYDLAVWWYATAPVGWRRLRVASVAHGRVGGCEATMWDPSGRRRAGAAQQVKLGQAD